MLNARHPLPRDGELIFLPETHVYLKGSMPVRKSVTKMLELYWPGFESLDVVENNFNTWRAQKNSKYAALIQYLSLVEGRNDEYCKQAIVKLWEANRDLAADTGTNMHTDFQAIVEKWPIGHEETHEMRVFDRWLASFCVQQNCFPFRAEWLIVLDRDGVAIVAGQVDLVLKHRDKDEYIGVDYKRTDPTPKFAGGPKNLLGPSQRSFSGETGTGPFASLEATDFNKYSAQLNAYAYIAATDYGVDFRDRMILVQIHPNLPDAHVVRIPRLDDEMSALFDLEGAAAAQEAIETLY